MQLAGSVAPGDTALLGLVAIPPDAVPADAVQAVEAQSAEGAVTGTVWLDFAPAAAARPG